MTFKDNVLRIVAKIPRGKTLTYKQVAKQAGNLRASRVVGNIMATNSNPKIPCHRVIRSDGKIGGYNKINGPSKRQLLREEGFQV